MRLLKNFLIIIILLCGVLSTNSFAGGKSGQVGIGLTVAESSPVFIFHYWASDKFTISPEFSVNRISDPTMTRFNFGVTLATHTRPDETFRPFFGIGLNYDVVTSNGESFGDIYFGPVFGGEYFFSDNFSVSGAYQLAIVQTDDIMSPAQLKPGTTYITSSQLLTVQFYF